MSLFYNVFRKFTLRLVSFVKDFLFLSQNLSRNLDHKYIYSGFEIKTRCLLISKDSLGID